MVKTVPFDAAWVTSDRLDIRGIYRRPRLGPDRKQVAIDGVPQWDLTGPLPVRRHNDHVAKGFQFVTLATLQDVADASASLRSGGHDPQSFVPSYEAQGALDRRTFRVQEYLKDAGEQDKASFLQLRGLVEELGSDAVERVKQNDDPHFILPESLRGIEPKSRTGKKTPAGATA